MPYPALPDHRIPYDADGTVVYAGNAVVGAQYALVSADLLELQDDDYATASSVPSYADPWLFAFFPCQMEITGYYARYELAVAAGAISGSNDTTNGLDGTWEAASLPGGAPGHLNDFSWRADIKPVAFTGAKKNIRLQVSASGQARKPAIVHLYGEPAAGQMAHDLIFLDPDLGAGVAFPAAEDFGDQPLGTTVVRPFRVKNTSASRTATTINIQCNDADFTIGESASGPWVATINIASLAAGAESATMYTKCTTPAPGAPLQPRFARTLVTCDAGFFG